METAEFLRQLAVDGARLAAVARAGDPDARVPGLDWTVRDVVAHTAGVHGWCADLVRERRTTNEAGSAAFAPDPAAADLVDRFATGVADLVEVLTSTPDDVTGWGFGHQVPLRAFWGRRQMHETAVHRADVERGVGQPVTPVGVDVAQDGLDEITFFASLRRGAPAATGSLALRATDGADRLVTFAERITTATVAEAIGADATVTGTSSDLYLWAWNRPAPVTVDGDPTPIAAWRQVRIR